MRLSPVRISSQVKRKFGSLRQALDEMSNENDEGGSVQAESTPTSSPFCGSPPEEAYSYSSPYDFGGAAHLVALAESAPDSRIDEASAVYGIHDVELSTTWHASRFSYLHSASTDMDMAAGACAAEVEPSASCAPVPEWSVDSAMQDPYFGAAFEL